MDPKQNEIEKLKKEIAELKSQKELNELKEVKEKLVKQIDEDDKDNTNLLLLCVLSSITFVLAIINYFGGLVFSIITLLVGYFLCIGISNAINKSAFNKSKKHYPFFNGVTAIGCMFFIAIIITVFTVLTVLSILFPYILR